MLGFVLAAMGLSWLYRHTLWGKVMALAFGLCLLAFTIGAGSTGGMVWVLALVLVLHSVYSLYRRVI